jgi:hypothetical protein
MCINHLASAKPRIREVRVVAEIGDFSRFAHPPRVKTIFGLGPCCTPCGQDPSSSRDHQEQQWTCTACSGGGGLELSNSRTHQLCSARVTTTVIYFNLINWMIPLLGPPVRSVMHYRENIAPEFAPKWANSFLRERANLSRSVAGVCINSNAQQGVCRRTLRWVLLPNGSCRNRNFVQSLQRSRN